MENTTTPKTVVVTGASSGIGRATVLMLAKHGHNVAFCARREQSLASLAAEVSAAGAHAYYHAFDVTDEERMNAFANDVQARFGRIDVWVNNASVYVLGRFANIPTDVFRRTMEVNFLGYLYGAKAVYPIFRQQGGGILINVDSMDGKIGVPYASAYVASKFAVRGLNEALRAELADQGIEVCAVLPAVMDTPLFGHAANYFGRKMVAMQPISSPDVVAEAILDLIDKPQKEVTVGRGSSMMDAAHTLAPDKMPKMMVDFVAKNHFADEAEEFTAGNLFEPVFDRDTPTGGWRKNDEDKEKDKDMDLYPEELATL